MSDFLHKKVIRLPLTPKIIQDLGFVDNRLPYARDFSRE